MQTSGQADVIVCRSGDFDVMRKPITIQDMDAVLDSWMVVQDRDLILPEFLYGRRKFLHGGGTQTLHLVPVQAWLIQAKVTKGGKR